MTNSPEFFLLDANSLMTPYLQYYPFDFAKRFWIQIEQHIDAGSIVMLDLVKDEIERGNDDSF